MSFFSKLFGRPKDPRAAFTAAVTAAFKARGVTDIKSMPAEFGLLIPDKQVFLENTFRHWLTRDAAGQRDLVARFVAGQLAPPPEITSLEAIAADLMPLVRSRANSSATALMRQIADLSDAGPGDAWQPLTGDLMVGVGVDLPDTIIHLQSQDLDRIKTPFATVLDLAVRNLAAKTKPSRFAPFTPSVPNGVYYTDDAEDYQSSLLLLPPDTGLQLPALDGDPVVLVPSRNQMFLTGSRNETGLLALAQLAAASLDVGHRCSGRLFRHDGKSWVPFSPPLGTAAAVAHEKALRAWDAGDYAEQKNTLEQLHQLRKDDTHVASFMVAAKDDEAFSIATWVAGVTDGLLPRTDRIAFVDQESEPNRMLDVPWDSSDSDRRRAAR